MVAGVRYAGLSFGLHGYLSAAEAGNLAGLLHHSWAPGEAAPVVIEHAVAEFSNGRSVSILRGMLSAGSHADFETCRMFDYDDGTEPIKHRTVESVQAELDAVAALPPISAR